MPFSSFEDARKASLAAGVERVQVPRRLLLKMAGVAAGAALIDGRAARADDAAPPADNEWSQSLGAGVVDQPYGKPSAEQVDVIRRNVPWLTAGTESSISFSPLQSLHGIITPNGLFFERYHAGRPDVEADKHRLMIHGLVDRPLILTMKDILRFPSTSRIHFIECPANGGMEWRGAQLNSLQFTHGMVSCAEWTGVKLSTLLEEVGLKKDAQWVLVEGADGAHMTRSLPLSKCLDDCLVVYAQNGEALRPEQGYPLRLIVPGWEGNVSVKWLRRIKVGDKPWYTREETSKYTDLMPDGKSRGFTWLIDAKSVITFPCPEVPLSGPGLYEIRGLAWTGNGRIKEVHVSTDGGVNWRQAELKDPVLSKALARFTIPWRWDGKPAFLESRAVDETGFVQPTLAALRQVRGTSSVYHNNAIQTWQVKPDGSIYDVQLG
ncbi:sulfite oxidase Sox [Afipia carboxidovorans OM5]|uniref:Sulfite oxidase Sox n=1 Tax=Afipia carboxidovorans (strain ATCC 49405 / DSM 1227 / KCTC 32145 / OM5) TaxID=504832 RepID=F8BW66_AFIC5|nr:sulfite dehydrogenase [Afipia carboxidovorans]AEI03904.1 sulfite oxidase Sox [Afipia carboxidovorans OM4]AEI07481.1 sulfite oxidase Sox [Afipia carboxidovorans OM5]